MTEEASDRLVVQLPPGWLGIHYLRASELQLEAERQQSMGWPTEIIECELP